MFRYFYNKIFRGLLIFWENHEKCWWWLASFLKNAGGERVNFNPLALSEWIDQHCMAIWDFRPLVCFSIVVPFFIGWGCDRDGFLLAGLRSHPYCLSSRHGCESTYLGFRMSGKIERTLAANIYNPGIFVLLLIRFQSALLWYVVPRGVWAGKFILGQRRHALICSVKPRHVMLPRSCRLTFAREIPLQRSPGYHCPPGEILVSTRSWIHPSPCRKCCWSKIFG